MAASTIADKELTELCRDLRRLWEQAGGPSVRKLADTVGLGKTQVSAILGGGIRRPPDWYVVRGMVEAFYKHAHDHGCEQELAIRAGLDEYWRPRHAMVEHALSQGAHRPREHPTATTEIVVPQQLPPVGPHFAGRQAELSALMASPSGPLLITGMAGVGKTTLAIAWAHAVASRFPDGQLYLNLRGFDPSGQPMTPAQAVLVLLEALVPAPHHLPRGFEAQIGLYRSLLAGKRMLVVLDNANVADQIRALLPGTAGCRVLATSRVELPGLIATDGASPLRLDVMPAGDARQLLANRLGPQRISDESPAVDRLIAVCGGLPLALAVVAARAASRPDFSLSLLADETDRARGSLSAFGVADPSADAGAIFSWSYRALSAPAARLFRQLGLVSFPDLGRPAAASLAGLSEVETAEALAELCRAHLVAEATPGRYVMHDLLRAYAAELPPEEPGAAIGRYLDYYVHTAHSAATALSPMRAPVTLDPPRDGVSPQSLRDRDEAMRWFATESDAVLAAARAAGSGHDSHVWRLGWAVADYYELRGRFADWVAIQDLAIAAASRCGDHEVHGRMLLIGGNAYRHLADLDGARRHLEAARAVFERSGSLAYQARAENDIGAVLERQGRHREALAHAQRSLELYRVAGDLAGQARARSSLGWCYSLVGQHERAIDQCALALAYYTSTGDINGEASTWDSIGHAQFGLGRHRQAIDCYRQALRCVRTVGDRYNEAGILVHLGDTYLDHENETAAYRCWLGALEIYDDLDQPDADQLRQRLGLAEPS